MDKNVMKTVMTLAEIVNTLPKPERDILIAYGEGLATGLERNRQSPLPPSNEEQAS